MAVQIGPVPSTDEKSHVRQNTAIQQLFKVVGQFSTGRVSKTGSYTVQNTDKNSKLGLNGGFFTLTFSNPSTYDSDFSVTIVNEDMTSAKVVVLPNYADGTTYTFFVWPLQSYLIFSENSKWFILGGKRRWTTNDTGTIAPTFYADPAGNDNNDGLDPTRACAGVKTLWDRIRVETEGAVIQMKQGATFGSLGELQGDQFGNFGMLIEILGDLTLVNPPTISVGASDICVKFRDGAWASLGGIKFVSTGSGSTGVAVEQASLCDLVSNNFGAFASGSHVSASDFSLLNLNGTNKISGATGAAGTAWSVSSMARLTAVGTFDGASAVRNNGIFLGMQGMCFADFSGVTFPNCGSFTGQKYNLSVTAAAISGGVVLPGSIAGTVDATSVYV